MHREGQKFKVLERKRGVGYKKGSMDLNQRSLWVGRGHGPLMQWLQVQGLSGGQGLLQTAQLFTDLVGIPGSHKRLHFKTTCEVQRG